MNIYEKRLNKLRGYLDHPHKALLLTNEKNIGYFCGFFHSEGVLLVTQISAFLFVDFRYIEAAEKYSKEVKVICFHKLSEDLITCITAEDINEVYFEPDYISLSRFRFFKSFLEEKNIEAYGKNNLDTFISDIRIIKDETEIQKLQIAQNLILKLSIISNPELRKAK